MTSCAAIRRPEKQGEPVATLKIVNAITVYDPVDKTTHLRLQHPDFPGMRFWADPHDEYDNVALLQDMQLKYEKTRWVEFDQDGMILGEAKLPELEPPEGEPNAETVEEENETQE